NDPRLWQRGLNLFDKRLKVLGHLFGRFSGIDIVAPHVKDNHSRLVRNHDAIGEMGRVRKLRAAEAAVNYLVFREILRQRLPQLDARRADEQDGSLWRWRRFVGRFKGFHVSFPASEGRLFLGVKCKRKKNEVDENDETL